MAEHELCKLGVTGSNPVASTPLRVREEACMRIGILRCLPGFILVKGV